MLAHPTFQSSTFCLNPPYVWKGHHKYPDPLPSAKSIKRCRMSLADLGTLQPKSRNSCQMSPSQILGLFNIKLAPNFKFPWLDFCSDNFNGLLCVFRIEITWISQMNRPREWAHIYIPSALFSSFQQSGLYYQPIIILLCSPVCGGVFCSVLFTKISKYGTFEYGLLYVPNHQKRDASPAMSACLFSETNTLPSYEFFEWLKLDSFDHMWVLSILCPPKDLKSSNSGYDFIFCCYP